MPPNIRLLAVESGDLLKYETVLKEIERYGNAVLGIRVDSFPVESISSARARRIYDWLCSVGREEMAPAVRTERVRLFLHQLAHNKADLCAQLDDALRRAGFEVARPAVSDSGAEERRVEQERARRREFERQREGLLTRFDQMATSADRQRRGYELQTLLADLLALYEVRPTKSFTRNDGAEQIDGAFDYKGWFYLVECRWRQTPADGRDLDGLLGQVNRSGRQTMGLFLSMEGWTQNVVPVLKQNPDKTIVLVDGMDLRTVLSGELTLPALLDAKVSRLNLAGEPFLSAVEILREQERTPGRAAGRG
ncbi:hypothetical protein FGE12_28585 [Aggregicoccus sp. 17bor-14]|uniref:hypothetical protein n=1 Tax=Myxococcaceae TaxID=31 RepID=UPI00129C1A83|nr:MULTISPECIES: hypothetical protein [Myxococcaceae]MBF5046405.1 hypothetical protein [Simulacricoccus sp. 17bor-14]MRI92125.1 hypothetical protein [Aggregicoccus sp. 17bor-14]